MKRTVLILILIPLLFGSTLDAVSQAPQSFSFQAVARDNNGDLIASSDLDIRLSLFAKSDEMMVWQETHDVNTSDLGLFVVNVGTGTRTGGSESDFFDIDWNSEQYSLKVELDDGSGYEDMGSSDLLSVPYALNAASVGSLKSLEVIEDPANHIDSALFEVKNNTGNTVFAVYNEGVRVYVDDNQEKQKGSKGGFAIGGFDRSKGLTYEYFRVTPDSVRIYLDEGTTKGPKGGFAIGGFDRTKGLTEDIMHLSEDNYFIGYESGSNITTGQYNSFFGYQAGVSNTEGSSNVFIGNTTGYGNLDGHWNIFLGNGVGYSNTSGSANIILGDYAGYSNTIGSWNVFMGDLAGYSNTDGEDNVYIGNDAGYSSTSASYNVFLGSNAGYLNTEGSSNVFVGETSGYNNITGESNVFIGTSTGLSNSIGSWNVFIGESAGLTNTIGEDNVFIGVSAGELNTEGGYNVFLGTLTGYNNTTGLGNVFLGQETGFQNTTGELNVALGPLAGYSNQTGSSNVFIGFEAGYGETGSNKLYIDNEADDYTDAFIYGEFDNDLLSFSAHTYVWGDLNAVDIYTESISSDSYLKGDQDNDLTDILDDVLSLSLVEYGPSKKTGRSLSETGRTKIGLFADELKEIFPSLVNKRIDGTEGINYSRLSVVLIQALKEQQAIIDDQEARLKDLEEKMELMMNK